MSTVEKPPRRPKRDRDPKRSFKWPGRRREAKPAKPIEAGPLIPPFRRNAPRPLFTLAAYVILALLCLTYGAAFAMNAPRLMVVFAIPLVVIVVLSIWALPSGEYAPVSAIRWLYFAFFASLLLWPNYLAIALPGLPWITLVRLTGVPLAAAMLICVSVSKEFRRDIKEVLDTDPWIVRALLCFVAVETVTLVFSKNIGNSANRYFVSQINWTTIFFASCYVFRRPGAVEAWVKILLTAGTILCVLGIMEGRQGVVLWAGHVPPFLKIGDESLTKILSGMARAYGTITHRVQGIYSTPLAMAECLGLTMPFALHYLITRRSIVVRLFCVVYIPAAIYVIILTDSRLGMVATLLSAVFYLLMWGMRRWQTSRTDIIAPAVILSYPAVFTAFVAATFFVGRLRNSVWGGGAQQASTDSRKIQWAMGIPKVMHAPWGHGQGRSASVLGYYAMDGTLTIDSYFLLLLLDYGILGFLFYLTFFLRSAWRGAVSGFHASEDPELLLMMPLAVAMLNFVVIKAVFSQEDNHSLAFMMAAAALTLAWRSQRSKARYDATAPATDRLPKPTGTRRIA